MILYDPHLATVYREYGIMLPISPSRADKIMAFLHKSAALERVVDIPGAVRLLGLPEQEPVITRADVERVHHPAFTAALYENAGGNRSGSTPAGVTPACAKPAGVKPAGGLEKALFAAWELLDDQGRPNRYEPDQAVKPLTDLFQQVLAQIGGTYLGARLALAQGGFCYYLGGGMHHGRYDHGAGFCLLNDIVIAARKLQAERQVNHIWVIDVDAHKGCGTAELIRFARNRGELGRGQDILNLSIHMAEGWPLDAETLASAPPDRAPRINADVEIPIPHGAEDTYLEALQQGITRLEENPTPDLSIVVDGADPYEHDGLPSSSLLKLSLEQCLERDRLIYGYLQKRRIPSVWIMAGGYGERAWEPPAHFLKSLFAKTP